MVKVPDYNAESRGLETLPSDIYLFENLLAADKSGWLFCHNPEIRHHSQEICDLSRLIDLINLT